MDLSFSRIASDIKQISNNIVCEDGYLMAYPDERQNSQGICIVYDPNFLKQPVDLNKPVHFIVLGRDVRLFDWGVPHELISSLEYPLLEKYGSCSRKTTRQQVRKVFYILEDVTNDLNYSISLSVIKSFNCLLHLEFYCVIPDAAISILKPVANDHITFTKNTGDYSSYFSGCDLLIASDRVAVSGILAGIPVIVVGRYGFGGLVTEDNFLSFIPSRFCGRPGGHCGDSIPPSLLIQEINYVFDVANTKELVHLLHISSKNMESLKIYCWDHILDSITKLLTQKGSLEKHINDSSLMLQLKPKLSAVIIVDERGKIPDHVFWLRNVNTNKILAVVSDFEMKLILQCDGNARVGELAANLGSDYNINDCKEFVRALWELRIVVFPD